MTETTSIKVPYIMNNNYARIMRIAENCAPLPAETKRYIWARLKRDLEDLAWTPDGMAEALRELSAKLEY